MTNRQEIQTKINEIVEVSKGTKLSLDSPKLTFHRTYYKGHQRACNVWEMTTQGEFKIIGNTFQMLQSLRNLLSDIQEQV